MSELDIAERELLEAIEMLRSGRTGASPAWVSAAEHYVDWCRERVGAIVDSDKPSAHLQVPEAWQPISTFFPRSGHRSN